MVNRMNLFSVVALLALVLAGTLSGQDRESAPLFTAGRTYTIAWDCLPTFTAAMASQATGQPMDPCYVEQLTVQAVRKDGWLQVRDDTGDGWMVNPARMIGFKSADVPIVAAK